MKKIITLFTMAAIMAIGFNGWGASGAKAIAAGTAPSADLAISMAETESFGSVNTATYTITVSNLGPASSTNVAVSDPLLPPLTLASVTFTNPSNGFYNSTSGVWTIFNLPASSSETLYLVTNFEADPGTAVTNTASVNATSTNDPNTANNTASASFVMPRSADLAITKTVSNPTPLPGAKINYLVTASALGPSTSTGVTVNDPLPAGLTFENATSSLGSYDPATGIWTIGDMAPSSSATLDIGAMVNASDAPGTVIHNAASGSESSSVRDPNSTNNSSWANIIVTPLSDLAVIKTVNNATPRTGDTINYMVTVSNLGPSTSTSGVIHDLLPTGLSFESAHATQGFYVGRGGYRITNGGTWAIGNLPVNATATLDIAALVTAPSGTVIVNTASTGGVVDPNPANNTSSVSIVVQNASTSTPVVAGLTIQKTVSNPTPLPGTAINYLLTVRALGPATSTGVTVNDSLPAGLTFENATSSSGSYDSTTGIWTIGDMIANSNATLDIGVLVNATDTVGRSISNTATVSESAIDTNPNAANASSNAVMIVGASGSGTSTSLTAPTNLTGKATRKTVILRWTKSTGGIAPIVYTIVRNGAVVGTTTRTMFVNNRLTASTTYTFAVQATDSATPTPNNAMSSQISVTTTGKKVGNGRKSNNENEQGDGRTSTSTVQKGGEDNGQIEMNQQKPNQTTSSLSAINKSQKNGSKNKTPNHSSGGNKKQ